MQQDQATIKRPVGLCLEVLLWGAESPCRKLLCGEMGETSQETLGHSTWYTVGYRDWRTWSFILAAGG